MDGLDLAPEPSPFQDRLGASGLGRFVSSWWKAARRARLALLALRAATSVGVLLATWRLFGPGRAGRLGPAGERRDNSFLAVPTGPTRETVETGRTPERYSLSTFVGP